MEQLSTVLVSLLFALKKARAAGQNVGIHCLIEVGTRENLFNMKEPTEKLPLQLRASPLYSIYSQWQLCSQYKVRADVDVIPITGMQDSWSRGPLNERFCPVMLADKG